METTVDYTDNPNYSHTLYSSTAEIFTLNTTIAPEDGTNITRVIDAANSWKANVNIVEATDELATVIQKKNFTVDANTT